jgi:hypothetical protein
VKATLPQRFGPFLTKVIFDYEDGRKTVATSRRHRKGLLPLTVRADGLIRRPVHPAGA